MYETEFLLFSHSLFKSDEGKFVLDFCEKYMESASVLLIGTGYTEHQYHFWAKLSGSKGAKNVEYLEVCDHYYQKWRSGVYKVTLGNVKDVLDIYGENSFDVIMWIQGPEHVASWEMKGIFDDLEKVSRRVVLASCPWGSYYDFQEKTNENIYEKHIQKSMDVNCFKDFKDYNVFAFGKKNASNGAIYIYK